MFASTFDFTVHTDYGPKNRKTQDETAKPETHTFVNRGKLGVLYPYLAHMRRMAHAVRKTRQPTMIFWLDMRHIYEIAHPLDSRMPKHHTFKKFWKSKTLA